MRSRAHNYLWHSDCACATLALLENTLRNKSSEVLDAQSDHQHVVHLTDNRDEIRDELDRTYHVKYRTTGNRLRMPRHLRVHESPPDNSELFENSLD